MEAGYTYTVFGLIIHSEFEIPELWAAEGEAEVEIRLGQVPIHLDNPSSTGVRFEAAPGEFLLTLDTIARYQVLEGKEIIVEPCSEAKMHDVRIFLLSSVFAALLHQRGYLVLHGSCIEKNGAAIVFSGVSGIGKSTLAAAFYQKGYPVLCDDLTVIAIKDEIPYVVSGIPSLKLWEDTLQKLGQEADSLVMVRESMQKYRMNLTDHYGSRQLPLRKIYILNSDPDADISVTELNSFERMRAINNNTFRRRFLEGQGIKQDHFKQCALLAKKVQVFRVIRPKGEFLIDKLLDRLEKEMA